MPTNIETLLDAIADKLESLTPDVRQNVPFKRWRGQQPVEESPEPHRMRAFQLRLGRSITPRTLSSATVQWQRCELELVVGYIRTDPRQADLNGAGIDQLSWIDNRQIYNALVLGNVFSANTNVKRLILNGVDEAGPTSRTWRFDLEWAETFS